MEENQTTPSPSNPALNLGRRGYELFVKVGDLCQSLLLLFFRVNFGLQLMQNGWGKLHHHSDIVEYFTSLGIPLPDLNAWVASSVECFGSALLVIGFASRPVGLLITFTMCVAYYSEADDRAKVFNFFKDQDPFFQAGPFFYLLLGILMFCFGPGKVSVDYLLSRLVFNKEKNK